MRGIQSSTGAAVFDMAWLDRSRAAPPAPAAGEAAVIRVVRCSISRTRPDGCC